MEDKPSMEIIADLAKLTNRELVAKEIAYPQKVTGRAQQFKRTAYMPNNSQESSVFIWYSDPLGGVGQTVLFSGAFIPISSNVKSKINIRNKSVVDKVNFLSKGKHNIVGSDYFDRKVIINGDFDSEQKRFLSHARLQSEIIQALKIKKMYHVSINEFKLDFVPELADSSYLGIINPHGWDTDRNDIEKLLRQAEKIRAVIEM